MLTLHIDDETLPPGSREVEITPGASTIELSATIANPRLWWPRPHGQQAFYTLRVELNVADEEADCREVRTAVRSIELLRPAHPEGGEYFTLAVNGTRVFCKGGNWVPADMIYADVTPERYRALIQAAADENMNTLRIWGGGLYMDHAFLDICDELGMLVWHDCIFARSKYPGGDPAFLKEVRREVRYVARELSVHPSLAVWCGNNELEWGAWEWGYDRGCAHPDYALFHLELPRIFSAEDPSRPYWPSSPYSPDDTTPNATHIGDQHPWHVSIGVNREEFYAYRGDDSRFPNEGGALGCSVPATLRQFLPEGEQHYLSRSWEYHDNEIAWCANSLMGEEWLQIWLQLDANQLSLEDYAFYSGTLQAEALLEYINNFRRRMWSTSSAIFWMYNDSWPVTLGWTTIDYYLRRKLAYHVVRRAFDPIQAVPVASDGKLRIYGVNDTLAGWEGILQAGMVRYDGADTHEVRLPITLAPNSATLLTELAIPKDARYAPDQALAFSVLWQNGQPVRQNRAMFCRHHEVTWAKPEVHIQRTPQGVAFVSNQYVWGVCLDPNGEQDLPDDMFDLLPGVPYHLPWPADAELPVIARCANLA